MPLAVGKSAKAIRDAGVETMLLTAHAAKGLEFERVLLGGDFKSVAPEGQDLKVEEANILYVSVTRAQSVLCLGSSEAAGEIRAAMGVMTA